MKFIHMADMHLDSPFIILADKGNMSVQRRIEQRNAMKEIVEYIKENNIPYFFIAGDLYEQKYITKSTIEYINKLFKEIPNTLIFITPGNHDPYIKNSFYKTFKWSENVHIFTEKLEYLETPEADIYGYGFDSFYMENRYKHIEIKNPQKINILITHGSLDSSDTIESQYNAIKSANLKQNGFDYVALGHIHKKSYKDYENQNIVYPGSTVSLGFDELGERGIIEGNVNKNEIKVEFIPIKTKTFEEIKVDITEINSKEELVQILNEIELGEQSYYKIILTGKRNFNINNNEIMELLTNNLIIKLKDETKDQYDIQELAKKSNLTGIFAKNILNKMEIATEAEKEKFIKAFEIGMGVLNKQ